MYFGTLRAGYETYRERYRFSQGTAASCFAGCGLRAGFGDPEQRDILTVEVDNPIGAKEGQLVCLEIGESEMLFAAVLLYLVPLLGLLAGLFAGRSFAFNHGLNGNPELWGLGLGLLLMALIFFVLRTQDKKFAKGDRFKVMITSVVNADEIPPELSAASPAGK